MAFTALGVFVAILVCGLLTVSQAQNGPAAGPGFPEDLPDPAALLTSLRQTPGCLGAELARSEKGKILIFSWFENKQGLLNWYTSAAHTQGMKQYFGLDASRTPLVKIPDTEAPIMAIASFTLAEKAHFTETRLPLAQLAIELYQPLAGGIAAGGRFAPEGLKVPNIRVYAPSAL